MRTELGRNKLVSYDQSQLGMGLTTTSAQQQQQQQHHHHHHQQHQQQQRVSYENVKPWNSEYENIMAPPSNERQVLMCCVCVCVYVCVCVCVYVYVCMDWSRTVAFFSFYPPSNNPDELLVAFS